LGGQGVPQDDAAAVRWWKKAAEQGDATAQGNLGTAYGLGTAFRKIMLKVCDGTPRLQQMATQLPSSP